MSARAFNLAGLALLVSVGVVLLLPAAAVFRRLVADGHRARPLVEILAFAAVVALGAAYVRARRSERDDEDVA